MRAQVAESVAGLVRTLLRLYADRGLAIDVDVPERAALRVQQEDLDRIIGNLLDNAPSGHARVHVTSAEERGDGVIMVDDDGRGHSEAMRQTVLQRGVRAR